MENFVVSARKYRPDTFDTVVGQGAITTTLKNAIRNGHIAQSFLFCGPRGVGKTTCARILAKTINCFNLTSEMEACGLCESCVSFKNSASHNIYELDAASNSGVDDIRSLIDQVRIPPQVGKYKIYIIDEVHMLSTAAFNAFLKTLEEPPAYAKFILATTEKHKILPTILSRCQIFDFKRIKIADMAAHLANIAQKENIQTESDALHLIAQKADGGLRDALSMFDQIVSFSGNQLSYERVVEMLNILDYDYYFQIVDAALKTDVPTILRLYNQIMENGFDGQHFVVGLAEHFRSLLVMQDPSTISLMEVGENIKERYVKQAALCSIPFLIKALELCNECDLSYKSSTNKRLRVEILLMQLTTFGSPAIPAAFTPAPTPTAVASSTPTSPVQIPTAETPPPTPTPTAVASSTPTSPVQIPTAETPPSTPIPAKEGGESYSLKNMLKTTAAIQTEEKKKIVNRAFEANELKVVWNEYLQILEDKRPGLSCILTQSEYSLNNKTEIELSLASNLQEAEVLDCRAEILEFLREKLQNEEISVKTKVDANIQKEIVYKPQDKFAKMSEVHPPLADFKKSLSLDLDF